MNDLLIQFFSQRPRRPLAVLGLLQGKRTISVLFNALIHRQLQWLHLWPDLSKPDMLDYVQHMQQAKWLRETPDGAVLTSKGEREKQAAQARMPLPKHYHFSDDQSQSRATVLLAVQVLSEYRFNTSAYAPLISDWAIQQHVKQWFRTVDRLAAISSLYRLFDQLPNETADRLANTFVGHDFVGQFQPQQVPEMLTLIDDWGQLISAMRTQTPAEWSGVLPPLRTMMSASAKKTRQLLNHGHAPIAIAQHTRRKLSTVNEHILLAAIAGESLEIDHLYSEVLAHALSQEDPWQGSQQILTSVPTSDFFQVRLYQILAMKGRWPHD